MPMPPQPPPEQASPESVILNKFVGLRNTVSSERLKPEELELGINVDIDDAGQLHRRRGYVKVDTGVYGSLWTDDDGDIYGTKDGVLGIINPDYSFLPLMPGVGSAPLAYVQVGKWVYFTSSTTSGKIDGITNVVHPWGQTGGDGTWLSPVVNPTATLPPIQGKLLGPPPLATFLTYFNGRIYMAVDKTVWCTELFLYDLVDRTRTFLTFDRVVTGLGTVTDGIYVGTTNDTWFCSGASLAEFKRDMVMSEGVIPGSMISIPGELADPHNQERPVKAADAVMFMTSDGLHIGMDTGETYNLTQDHVWFPWAASVAPLFRRQDGVAQFIGVLDSQGTPADGARIGDYVTAEIIRFKP